MTANTEPILDADPADVNPVAKRLHQSEHASRYSSRSTAAMTGSISLRSAREMSSANTSTGRRGGGHTGSRTGMGTRGIITFCPAIVISVPTVCSAIMLYISFLSVRRPDALTGACCDPD